MTDTRENIKVQPRDSRGKLLPTPKDTPTLPILSCMNDIIMSIRTKHPEVPQIVLVVGSQGYSRTQMKHGHFDPASWESKSGTHEIMISGESLKRGAEATLGTLLHECAHALANARDIKDTSRQGRFHNKRFKFLAEEIGIEVENDPSIGWSITTLPKETAKLYSVELKALGKALKAFKLVKVKPKAPKTTIRLVTESGRGLTVPIKFYESGNIVDEETGEIFEPVAEDGDYDE